MDSLVASHGSALSTPELAAQLIELAGHLNAANRHCLALMAEFDRREGWNDGLTRSCAHWLNWQCGIDIERLDDGAWRFVKRSGEALHSCAPGCTRPLGDWTQLPAAHVERGITIDASTAATRWRGERMDHVLAIDLLVARVERSRAE